MNSVTPPSFKRANTAGYTDNAGHAGRVMIAARRNRTRGIWIALRAKLAGLLHLVRLAAACNGKAL